MNCKEKLKNWLWLGLDEATAKKYQRKVSVDNVRIIRNESIVVSCIGAVYGTFFLASEHLRVRGLVCMAGVMAMFVIFLYSHLLLKKGGQISKREAWLTIGAFMLCAYIITIYIGTLGARNEFAVMIVCMFIFLPTNFDILPVYNFRITLGALVAFLACSYFYKTFDKFIYDMMDGILAVVIGNFAAWERAKIKWESVRVNERLKEERDMDMLTGIWNRRAFEREVERRIDSGDVRSMVLIMLDIDKFKQINDGYGHETGDAYLRHFCELFREFTEKNTIVGRRSGDEFFIFIYNFKDLSKVKHNVRELYRKLEKNPILLPDGTEKIIHVSAGVVWTTDMENDWKDLLSAADEALYYVKEHGRNHYVIEEYAEKR